MAMGLTYPEMGTFCQQGKGNMKLSFAEENRNLRRKELDGSFRSNNKIQMDNLK
jgi:hypothetical protein